MHSFKLETQRLFLRSFQASDLAAFAAYRSDPQVACYQGWDAPYPLATAQAFIAEMRSQQPGSPGAWFQVAIERREQPGLVGDCAFCLQKEDPRQAEIGFTLARAWQGRGYAAEAVARLLTYLFLELGVHRATAICDTRNVAAARLLERLGMRREGCFIENVWFKGAWGSEYLYALLESEWQLPASDVGQAAG